MALSKEEAKRLSIISVAEQLGMELKRTGSHSYNWVEHDSFVIDTKKNEFYWNSRTEFGDVIQLVQTIRGVSYKEAMHFLETGEFNAVDVEAQTATKEPFSYHLERYERQDFSASRSYLKAQRGLSDDTINFFISQGSIAEAIRKKGDYFEPVIVFKYKDNTGFLAGASLQGIVENREHYPERGRLKQIMRNSDGQLGFSIDIGNPKRLVFAEAPIDLMSYYELHKDRLQDVRLVAMDGVKEGIISRRFMELYAEINDKSYQVNQNTGKALEVVARTTNYFKDGQHQDMITLAVDNDMAGHKFITSLQEKGIPVQIAIPPILHRDQEKEDWNDFLKRENEAPKELAHVYIADEKSWHYQGFFEKEIALGKAQELSTQDVKTFVSDVQLTKEEVRQEYQTIINQERGRKNSMSKLHENSSEHEEDLVNKLLSKQKKQDEVVLEDDQSSVLNVDTSHLSPEEAEWLKKNWNNIGFSVQSTRLAEPTTASEEKEKSLDNYQETANNSERNKKIETKLGDFPEETQGAAPLPEANISQPLNDLSPSQTRSQPLLHFSINDERMSIHKDNYHPISDKDLLKLNRYALHLQNAAQWYLENVADSQVTYFYQDGADTNSLAISYNKESFMHLTGIYPYREGQTAEQTLLDFANGNGQFDNILIANRGAAFDKLKVLPELPAIVDAESFYFGDLSDVEKFHSLNLDKAIRSNDQDVLLAFRTVDGTVLPASLMRLRKSLNLLLEQTNQEKIILGVFRERDDHIEQLSINEEYVKDKGAEMLSVLKNKQFEEIKPTMNVNHQIKISSYNFNNQEYSDLESMLQVGASYLQTPEGKAWLLEDKEYHQDILLKNFESKVSTPKQKLAVMSELGTVRVNGYDLLPGMAYYDALSDDGKYLDNKVIKRIDDELLNLSSGVSAEEELHYEEQLIDLAESRGIAEQENLLNQTSLDSTNVDHQVKISSYNFNNQEYFDLESMLQAGASYLQTPEGKAWLLEDKEYHQDILLKNFESKVSTPKQKLAVMSELGTVRVNGYDLLPGMAYYDALSDDGKYLDNKVIKRIDDELLNLSSGVSAEEELHYEEQLIDLAESRGIAEQENLLNQTSLDSATFTQVLDTVYNLGVPNDISKTPEEFHQACNQYLDYAKQYNDEFDQIVAAAVEDHLLDTNSDFYKEWKQDHIYKENYHVRLQWAEERPEGPILPFKETELISYQDFTRELYKANQSFYQLHQDGLKQVTGDHPEAYISPTKIQFSIYAPDGELIQDGIRYNIGEEINPIAHKERLGTREMREYPELIKLDGALFNQYHLERLASELDISQFSYALEDIPYADQLLSQLPYGDLKNSPIGFTDSSHDSRLGFISFDGMDSVEVKNLSAWFEKLGVKDSPLEQVALVEKWQKEVNDLSEKVEQTMANVREEFEKLQVKDSQNTPDNPYEKIYQYNRKDERDRDLDGDGISNSDEMLQGTDPYNSASNLHKKQEDRERRTDVEVATGAIVTDAIAAKSSEQTISQLVANKDTKALAEHLKEGMKNYLDSEQFKSFLDTMSKFHNYSLNNIHLLKMQNPNVSQVASFNKWKTDFDRTVKKGSKALKIWVPYQVKTSIPVHQKELDFTPAENEMEQKEIIVTRFKLGNVFDVSQTEGKELPKAINELTGDVKDYEDLYRAAKAVSMDNQVPISFEEIKRESTNGYYSPDENRIVISKGLKGQEQILKTIFHEMAHADLHRGSNAQYGDDQYRKQELQAESVAYVVANHFGFDTSSYSFGYLAIWAKDKNGFEDMVEQLQVVQKEAKSLIDRMDAKLELVKNKSVTKDKFADKLQQAKEKSEQLGNQKAEAVKQVEEKKSLSSPQ